MISTVQNTITKEVSASLQFGNEGLEMIICDDEGNIKDRVLFDIESIVREHLPYHFVRDGVFHSNKDKGEFLDWLNILQAQLGRAWNMVSSVEVEDR